MTPIRSFRRVLIVADESADWIVAGLRQLERVALSIDEFAVENKETAPVLVCIFWRPDLDRSQRWVPKHPRLTKVAFTEELDGQPYDLILNTRLFLHRKSVQPLLDVSVSPPIGYEWAALFGQVESLGSRDGAWSYLADGSQIDDIEIKFLRDSGKSQDGFVSRYLNRPISRVVTRLFLRFPTTPNGWTWSIFAIPIIALLVVVHGSYWSFVWGLVLYQVYSVLDGCDGEIARAKFLESESGRQLDALCDVLSNILLALGLGVGLSRQATFAGHSGGFFLLEGLALAVLIGVNEFLLERKTPDPAKSEALGGALYPRHRELVERSGLLFFGESFASWLIQLTKRDVAVLFFVFLAVIGLPALILHLLFVVSAITLAFTLRARFR